MDRIDKLKNKTALVLRKSEKYSGTDMVYITKHGTWITLGSIITNVLGFFVTLAFANLLPVDTYGHYRYILSFMGFFTFMTLPGMSTAAIRSVARGFEGSIVPATKLKIKYGLIGTSACLALSSYYFYNNNDTLGYGLILISLFIPFINAFNTIDGLYNGRQLFKESLFIGTSTTLIYSLVMIGTLYLTNNVFLVLFSYLAAKTLTKFLYFLYGLVKFRENKKVDPDMIGYGKKLTLIQVISSIAGTIDKILVFHFLGAAQLAIYSFSTILPDKIKTLTGILNKLAMPKFSQGDGKAAKDALPKKLFKYFLLLVPIAGLYILLTPLIYRLIFPEYSESIFYSQIYAISILVYPQMFLFTFLKARMKTKEMFLITTFTPILRIGLYLILIPIYGIMGAIITFITVRTFNFGFQYYLFKKSDV